MMDTYEKFISQMKLDVINRLGEKINSISYLEKHVKNTYTIETYSPEDYLDFFFHRYCFLTYSNVPASLNFLW